MSIKYKHLKLVLCSLVVLVSTWGVVLAPRSASADPVASCDAATGAVLNPATADKPSFCSCPSGKVLVTGNPNTCKDGSSCPSGTNANTQADGSVICNEPVNTGGTICADGSNPVTDNKTTCPGDTAATSGNCSDSTLHQCDLIKNYVNPLIQFLSALVGVAVTIAIVIGAIQYGSSAGDPQKAAAAKDHITKAAIALITFLFLYALLNFLIPGGIFNT